MGTSYQHQGEKVNLTSDVEMAHSGATTNTEANKTTGESGVPDPPIWYIVAIGGFVLLFVVVGLSIALGMPNKESSPPPPPPLSAVLPACSTEDDATATAYLPVTNIPEYLQNNYIGVFPDSLDSFSFVDAAFGQMDAVMNFANANTFASNPNAKPWCNMAGQASFRIVFYGLCYAGSDDQYEYINVVARSQLSEDCLGWQAVGNCRRIQVSKPGAASPTWTESQNGVNSTQALSPTGGVIDIMHAGGAVNMKIKWSMCPATIDLAQKQVEATF